MLLLFVLAGMVVGLLLSEIHDRLQRCLQAAKQLAAIKNGGRT